MATRAVLVLLVATLTASAQDCDQLVREFLQLGRGADGKAYNRRETILFTLRDRRKQNNDAAYQGLLRIIPKTKLPGEFVLAAIFAGNVRTPAHAKILAKQARKLGEESAIRVLADQLRRKHTPEVARWIVDRGLKSTSPIVAAACCRAAGALNLTDGIPRIRTILKSYVNDRRKRRLTFEAAYGLGIMKGIWLAERNGAASHNSVYVRLSAAELVPYTKNSDAATIEAVRTLLKDPDRRVRKATLDTIAFAKALMHATPCIEALEKDPHIANRAAARRALKAISGRDFEFDAAAWRQWLKDKSSTGKPKQRYSFARYYGHTIAAESVCFIVDLSGSMKGTRLSVAKQELLRALGSLPEKTRFNIVAFAENAHVWRRKGGALAKPKKLKAAEAWIGETFRAGGQTNTWAAIEAAFRADTDLDTIFLLSDGAPSRGDYENVSDIAHALYALNWDRRVTIHTIALSLTETLNKKPGTWGENFMQWVAKHNGGECRIVTRRPN